MYLTIPPRLAFALGLAALSLTLGTTAAHADQCSPQKPSKSVAPGVTYWDCSGTNPAVHIVTIDRTLPAAEMQILDDVSNLDPYTVNLKTVEQLARDNHAIVAINGYNWSGQKGTPLDIHPHGTLTTTTYTVGEKVSDNVSGLAEVLLGFKSGGPRGLQPKRLTEAEFALPENLAYRQELYGSNTTVMRDGACQSDDDYHFRLSVVGYSPTHIVLLSTAGGEEYFQQQLCPALASFGVTDAIRNDGGPSAAMYVGGSVDAHVNPLTPPYFFEYGTARRVAFAVGLVPTIGAEICRDLVDRSGAVFASLCVDPRNDGYNAFFVPAVRGPLGACGTFDFNLVAKDGRQVGDQGAFPACSNDTQFRSYFFATGTMGGCAKLQLLQRDGADFGATQWEVDPCAEPGGEGGGGGTGGGGGGEGPPPNRPPVVSAGPDVFGDEGAAVTLAGSVSDPDSNPRIGWSYQPVGAVDPGTSCTFADAGSPRTTFTCNDDGVFRVRLQASDGVNGPVVRSALVTIRNVAPTLALAGPRPWQLFRKGVAVNVAAPFTDPGANDGHTCTVDWDDGSVETFAAIDGGRCDRAHAFARAGMFTVEVSVVDDDGGRSAARVLVVSYDPEAGTASGNGWLDAARSDAFAMLGGYPSAAATVPRGSLTFSRQSGLALASNDQLEWVVITPDHRIAFKGTGRLASGAPVGFVLYVHHGAPEHVRVLIWDLAAGPIPDGATPLFDNSPGASFDLDRAAPPPIAAGTINIAR
jgi:hypothetical protein